jgi:serine/threonine protein kinase
MSVDEEKIADKKEATSLSVCYSITTPVNLVSEIASGSFATVYKATYQGVTIAVKRLHELTSLSGSSIEDAIETFHDEIDILRKLQPLQLRCAIKYYGHREDVTHRDIFMEYVAGDDLRESMSDNVSPLRRAEILEKVMSAGVELAYHRVVHNDLKPHNIMLTDDDEIKIVDWGFAIVLGKETYTTLSCTVGSVNYMAPEMAVRNKSSLESDLYSLGGVIFALTFGKAPFWYLNNPFAILNALAANQHSTFPAKNPEYTRIIESCWQKETARLTVHELYKQIGLLHARLQHGEPSASHAEVIKVSNKLS